MNEWLSKAQVWVNQNFIFFLILCVIALMAVGWLGSKF